MQLEGCQFKNAAVAPNFLLIFRSSCSCHRKRLLFPQTRCSSTPPPPPPSFHFSFLCISVSLLAWALCSLFKSLWWKAHFKRGSSFVAFSLISPVEVIKIPFPWVPQPRFCPLSEQRAPVHSASQLFWSVTHLFAQNFFSSLRKAMQ